MDDYALHLYAGEVFVGALKFDPGSEEFALEYDPTWVKNPAGFPLSPHLPLAGDASSGTVKRFVENLLPEGNALDVASKHSNIMRNNIFGLIRHLGRETAGALSFVPVGQKPGEGAHRLAKYPSRNSTSASNVELSSPSASGMARCACRSPASRTSCWC